MTASRTAAGPETAPLRPDAIRPRLGFVGVGWIGRMRLAALARSGVAEVVALVDPSPEQVALARHDAPEAAVLPSLEALLESDVDGVVIATPSGLHAEQARLALASGKPVFCQKPLGRTAAEAATVVAAARDVDRLLAVDLSYRYTAAMRRVGEGVQDGEIGRPYAADLVFHNAYGPDNPWCRNPALAGGGCLMDLGIHLADLCLWTLGFPRASVSSARVLARGERIAPRRREVEDYAVASFEAAGVVVRLACSWWLPAGRDAEIGVTFYGTGGALAFRNVGGSFYDFVAEQYEGRTSRTLVSPPDDWGGRALVHWARRVGAEQRFDPSVEHVVEVAELLDRIYASADD